MNKNLKEISLLSVILTFFVIAIHLMSEPLSSYVTGSLLKILFFIAQKLISFSVPGFIFLSAFKTFRSIESQEHFKYQNFMKKRFTKIYIPYLIFVNIYYIYFIDKGFVTFTFSKYVKGILLGTVVSPFYFIVVIFQFYLLMPLFIKYRKGFDNAKGLLFALFLTMLFKGFFTSALGDHSLIQLVIKYKDRIFIFYFFYWVLGCFCSTRYDLFIKALGKNKISLTILYFIITIIHIALSYMQFIGVYSYRYSELPHILFCTISILWFYWLSYETSKWKWSLFTKFYLTVDEMSLYIYLSHSFFIYVANEMFYQHSITKISERFILRSIFVFFCAMFFSYGYTFLVKKIKKRSCRL